jgi:hypothetical protein
LSSFEPSGAGGPARSPDPNLIFVLNLLVFGCAGYWLLGQREKAVIAAIGWVAGLATCGVVSGAVMAFAAVDGFLQAQQLAAGQPIGRFTFFRANR